MRALIGAKDALVFAGEGIAIAVLQQTAGPDDDRRLAEIIQHLDKLLHEFSGKVAGDDAPARLVQVVEQGILAHDLTLAMEPAAVIHQVGIEDVGTDEEGVVGLQQLPPAGVHLAQDGPRQQHAHGFAADETRTYDSLPDGQQVAEVEIFFGQTQDALLAAEDHLRQGAKHLPGLLAQILAPLLLLPDPLRLQEGAVPLAQSEMHGVEARPGLGGQDLRDGGAVRDRREVVALPDMQHVHGRRVAMFDLARLDIDLALAAIDLG